MSGVCRDGAVETRAPTAAAAYRRSPYCPPLLVSRVTYPFASNRLQVAFQARADLAKRDVMDISLSRSLMGDPNARPFSDFPLHSGSFTAKDQMGPGFGLTADDDTSNSGGAHCTGSLSTLRASRGLVWSRLSVNGEECCVYSRSAMFYHGRREGPFSRREIENSTHSGGRLETRHCICEFSGVIVLLTTLDCVLIRAASDLWSRRRCTGSWLNTNFGQLLMQPLLTADLSQ